MELKPLKADKTELLSILSEEQIYTITTLLTNFDKEVLTKTGAIDILTILEAEDIQFCHKMTSDTK